MTKPWTEFLTPSRVTFMNDIISQVPEAMGVRNAFIKCLQDLADVPVPPKFRFLITGEGLGDVQGTNNEELARESAVDEANYVIDLETFTWMCDGDLSNDAAIMECRP